MKRALVTAALAFSLLAHGCDDDPATGGKDGGAGGSGGAKTGGAGGAANGGTGGTAAGGAGGASAGGAGGASDAKPASGGASGDAAKDTPIGSDAADVATVPGTIDIADCMNVMRAGVDPAVFCTKYMSSCGFGAASMGRAAGDTFADMTACMNRYGGYSATQKGCATYHLCEASKPNGAMTHCPHPVQAGSPPCNLPGM